MDNLSSDLISGETPRVSCRNKSAPQKEKSRRDDGTAVVTPGGLRQGPLRPGV